MHSAEAEGYQRAITIEPSKPGSYLPLATLNAYAFDRFFDAVPLARKAMELDSGSPVPPNALAFLYFDLDDDNNFFETTAQAAKRWPDSPAVQYRLALNALLLRDAAGAVRHAQRTFDEFPKHDWALAILRNADLQSGHYDAALARYEKGYPELFVQSASAIFADIERDMARQRAALASIDEPEKVTQSGSVQ